MRSYRRNAAPKRGSAGNGSFWLSFSDLMSALVLIIVLVLFYIIYQYFSLAESNERELKAREAQLLEQQSVLNVQQAELDAAKLELESSQAELTSAQSELQAAQLELESSQAELLSSQNELVTAQNELVTAQNELKSAQNELDSAKSELTLSQGELTSAQAELTTAQLTLAAQQAQLDERDRMLASQQSTLNAQQSRLAAQQAQLDSQQRQLEELIGMKPRIIAELSTALRASNVQVSVDPSNGSIALASDVLFESGRYELTDRGKAFIDVFLPVYLDVLLSTGYRSYLAEIIIEGHTDTDGSYIDNLQLSLQRALAVERYVELGCHSVTADQKNMLRKLLTVNGRSYSDPILRANGTEDKDASRRVVFKFRLTDEQMVTRMRDILES